MNKSISKIFNEDHDLVSQAKNPSEYIMLKHDENELLSIPIDPNLLYLEDKRLQHKYFRILYTSQDSDSISREFSYNLLGFYINLTFFLLIILAVVLLLYQNNEISQTFLIFHISAIGIITFYSGSVLIFILKIPKAVLYSRVLFTIQAFLMYLYIIFGTSEVLSGLNSESLKVNLIPMSLGLLGFTYSYRRIMFDSYKYLIFTLIPILICYIIVNLVFNKQSIYAVLAEFATIALFIITQIIESHTVENRTIQLFYRMEKEQESEKEDFEKSQRWDRENFGSISEGILQKCDFIMRELKYAATVIIFKDIKNRLKNAQAEMKYIKKTISRLDFNEKFDLSGQDLDEEDKQFISQNYLNISPHVLKDLHGISQVISFTAVAAELSISRSLLNAIQGSLAKVGVEWNFNTFLIKEKTGHSISVIAIYLFEALGLESILKVPEDIFFMYFEGLEQSYKQNPYHNALHGADVFVSVFYFINNSEIIKFSSKLDQICTIIASLGHDAGHPGLTNRFLVQSRDHIAIQYNDQSVLENMHCSLIFSLMQAGSRDIFRELKEEDWVNSRKMIISMILETDLSRHFEICAKFKNRALVLNDLFLDKHEDKVIVYAMALKCADIGHSAKSKELHLKWTNLVMEEFFNQGDIEKSHELPVSMYCDRNNTDIPKSQAGFIKNISMPLYETWCTYLKSSQVDLCLHQLKENFVYWDENFRKERLSKAESKRRTSLDP